MDLEEEPRARAARTSVRPRDGATVREATHSRGAPGARSRHDAAAGAFVAGHQTLVTTARLAHLQHMVGNRAVTSLAATSSESRTQPGKPGAAPLQRDKGPALPGRQKRRRIAEEEELAAMADANAAWEAENSDHTPSDPTANPYAALAVEDATETTPGLTLDDLARLGDNAPAIRALLTGHFPADLASEISRVWRGRSGPGTRGWLGLDALIAAARVKLERRGEQESASYSPPAPLNARGQKAANIVKGTGDGYLAGTGAAWHVHHDHVKYGSRGDTRINFAGRTRAAILASLSQAAATVTDTTHLAACRTWIEQELVETTKARKSTQSGSKPASTDQGGSR